ncbi:MAG TPA: carbon-nitrogen hydrolase family protein [Gammaproteobacteria bacterium]|nr:carbon-nitrogen hydrolase family protein [Gammaproteobacteria bacterium]
MHKIAAIQMRSSHLIDDNLNAAAALIQEAASNGAKLIVLPEMFAIFGITPDDKVSQKEVLGEGKIQTFLQEQAKRNHAWIVGGTIPIACDIPNKILATSLLINDKGEVVAAYDKIHLFDVELSPTEIYCESDTTKHGDTIVLADTPFGKLGMSVCYDVRFPELFRTMFNHGAEIFVIPSAFTVPTGEAHWELLARARAVENFSYVIGACQGGLHSNGRKTYGHSVIIDPWGRVISKMDGVEPGVIYADIDLTAVHQARKSIPVDKHQTIAFNIEKLHFSQK